MTILTKKEELISCQMSAFKNFVMEKQKNISNCSFEIENDICTMGGVYDGSCINLPTGVRQVKISIFFGESCSEDKQKTVENFVREFINQIQRGIEKGEVNIYGFMTKFDFYVENSYTLQIKYRQ